MNYRFILSVFTAIFFAHVSTSYPYIESAAIAQLPNQTYLLNFGDCHTKIQAGADHTRQVKNLITAFQRENIPLKVIVEWDEDTSPSAGEFDTLGELQLFCLQNTNDTIKISLTDRRGRFAGALLFDLSCFKEDFGQMLASVILGKKIPSQLRRALKKFIHAGDDGVLFLDDALCREQIDWDGISQIKEIVNQHWHDTAKLPLFTKQQLMDELTKTINDLKSDITQCSSAGLDQLICDIEEEFGIFTAKIKECKDSQTLFEFLFDSYVNDKSLTTIDAIDKIFTDLSDDIAEVGFLIELEKGIEQNQHMLIYTGVDHAQVITNVYSKQPERITMLQKNEVGQAAENLDSDLFLDPTIVNEYCTEFQKLCCANVHKNKRKADQELEQLEAS